MNSDLLLKKNSSEVKHQQFGMDTLERSLHILVPLICCTKRKKKKQGDTADGYICKWDVQGFSIKDWGELRAV